MEWSTWKPSAQFLGARNKGFLRVDMTDERIIMQRTCFTFKIKVERIAEYKVWHSAVWPEMLQALSTCGFRNYSLFMREDGTVFGYLESDNLAAANACMAQQAVNTRWQAEMAPFFESISAEPWTEVFHLA